MEELINGFRTAIELASKYLAVFKNAPVAMAIADENGEILEVNRRAEIIGFKKGQKLKNLDENLDRFFCDFVQINGRKFVLVAFFPEMKARNLLRVAIRAEGVEKLAEELINWLKTFGVTFARIELDGKVWEFGNKNVGRRLINLEDKDAKFFARECGNHRRDACRHSLSISHFESRRRAEKRSA